MAVDMTDLTIVQYRQRIEEMSVEEIQKILNITSNRDITVQDL